ncbi:MAG: prepilin-type N-terminal cleavage/methylation domain-containing protein [Rickettsiales bacterium]|nr:prepilin-type N-terminal cleavage/methylation domain-containing protein [Rickettsiales bacterium]
MQKGFTVLELLIVLALIGIVTAQVLPVSTNWTAKESLSETSETLMGALNDTRSEAQIRSTTTRLLVQRNGDTYTLTAYTSPSPVNNCDTTGTWNALFTRTMEINNQLELTGTGVGHVCFYRDGTASGGVYTIAEKADGGEIGSKTITVTIATGYLDVAS